jgi:phosphatidylinositol alpha-mannosyltransferase
VRVLLVCPYSFSLPGGVQGQVLGLARALRARGHDIVVAGPCDGPPPEPGVVPLGNSIPFASNGSIAPVAPDPAAFVRTWRLLRAEGPDVVHLHEPMIPGPTWTPLLTPGVASVGTFHAAGRVPAYVYFRPIMRSIARRITVRTAVSDDARRLAERYLGGACKILANGVEVERFAKAEPWPTSERAIVFVGRHEPRKGLDVLLAAFAELDRDAVLWVIGEGPQTDELKARGVERVEWLGKVSDAERCRRLRGASVFCAPSLHGESFGVVLLEAMAAGVPVVASDIDGYKNVARDAREALLVAAGDARALRDALRRILDEPPTARELVDAGHARASEFSMDRLAERYVALYEEARAVRGG